MPGLIGVNEFVEETREDYNSPTTSTFVSRIPQCRRTVATLEETLDFDRDGLSKMRKAIKSIHNSGNSHVDNEMYFSRVLDKLGEYALNKDQEPDIGAAFLKFAVVTKELSALMKTLMQNINNIVMFPLETLLKGDLRGVRGDLKRPFDKAWKDYEAKYSKIEKEKKAQAKEAGLIRTEVKATEIADELDKERKMFQLHMCEYLIKVNEIKTKKGTELLQHLVEYYHAQTNYFQDGLKTIEHFGGYVSDLSTKLQKIRQKQDEERKKLGELRTLLRNAPGLDKEPSHTPEKGLGYSLHQLQGDKGAGVTRSGHLLKKSEGKMRRVWQKRKCCVQADGFLDICHGDETKPPTRVNLLTCQIKPVPDDKRFFDLVSYNRTYHFQAEDEADQKAWLSVLVNCKESALLRAFDDSGKAGVGGNNNNTNPSLLELQQTIIKQLTRLPGNDRCCDCNSTNDATWLCTNFGVVVCIECSGIHRDLGVHISRIQSLTLDNIGTSQLIIARHMSNPGFNEVMEAKLSITNKPNASSTMEERCEFIRAKYVDKKFVMRTCHDEKDLLSELEHAVNNRDLYHLLQVWGEGGDLSAALPNTDPGGTALHLAITREMSNTFHLVDFLIQNMPSAGLDKPTSPAYDSNTALHLCALLDKTECMKLLLRSGASPTIRNGQDKAPLELAQERGHRACEELLRSALTGQKNMFEHVIIDWNLNGGGGHDEVSTDFSDDETMVDDRNGCVTPERKQLPAPSSASRPSSYAESPRSRSSTCDSSKSASYRQMPPPSSASKKLNSGSSSLSISGMGGGGTLKKRAPPPPQYSSYGTLPSNHHTRSPSDPHSYHKRSPSNESNKTIHLAGAKLVIPPGEIPTLKSTPGGSLDKSGNIKRPQGPPPPTPSNTSRSKSQSNESLSSLASEPEPHHNPVPPPRKKRDESPLPRFRDSRKDKKEDEEEKEPYFYCPLEQQNQSQGGVTSVSPVPASLPRCRALYDCSADNEDELSFREGDILRVLSSCPDDDNWMEGMLEHDPGSRGMFPISFVQMLPPANITSASES
uniref:Arf-GAP with SH3 domain, ANK repeat and PH domain-containing protein 1 n=1 Tax=Cacopsylla melanoneura TaxID=428564 RepID=A0A8D8M2C7_9HEMI